MAVLNPLYADTSSSDEANAKIGETIDTGGSTTAGTVMAKLNLVLAEISNLVASSGGDSTALSEKLDQIVSYVDTLETTLATVNTNAATAATKSTAAATDAASAKTNTAINNTASSTGTLSQKLSHISSSLIGATNATGGSASAGTVMAKLNNITNAVGNTYTQALNGNTKCANIQERLGVTGDTGGSASAGTAMAKLNAILTTQSSASGAVRKIQKGVGEVKTQYVSVNITLSGFTESAKMIAILHGGKGNSSATYFPRVTSLTTTELVVAVGPAANDSVPFSYQVVEFY